ncbi:MULTISPECIES: DUF1571 domain-containing protein [Burkholderia]|uniref:DUF1571 domain-containing protein n=1 Tax=Burkholderia TaxID=32008 RepID=UPI00025F06D0|nr:MULTISPECIES: DUF1571 domain-containing protein [Burkholderia]AFJ85736.1 hypothetical protein MYA_1374 [Burkholderia sp. KJ006]MBR8055441.1 DUF1571 domain-containing protein [Burkholderia vietnamiensis]HDR9048850.1 DUF1571 domain-containing protein [Burkholderia vietnamiensis]HDR9232563.1 DUF1571 domain-containing protein [Burkholderia vietnamiensis]
MNPRTMRRAAHAAAAVACMLTLAPPPHAQETAAAAASAPTATATTLPAELDKVTHEPAAQQARWLRAAAQRGTLAQLDDATLTALFNALDPLAVPLYVGHGPNGYPSYQFTMARQERINGKWPDTPDRMLVKTTREPLRVYAKWLPGGAHAGQETIYDTTLRKDEMYGHLGGLLGKIPLWTALDGALARAQSNHQVKDLGTEFIANLYLSEARKYQEAGVQRPTHVEAKTIGGVRVVALTYETPTGRPQFYAKKEVLGLDLHAPYFRTVESYDNDGRIFERIVIETIAPATLDASAFDPKNPDYAF